ncbi:MAG TPA: hypothetical protein VGO59_17790 [Verrucomicrobiae bacterium]|jgi:hypothetical protein
MIAIKKLLLFAGLLALLTPGAQAQPYSLPWYKIAGGGGTSSNGGFLLNGTLGQHDASGTLSNGLFTLTGGFWGMVSAVQTPNAPALSVTHSNNTVIVSWPATPGFTLQQNAKLATGNWVASTLTVSTNAGVESVTISNSTGRLFFRLVAPIAP